MGDETRLIFQVPPHPWTTKATVAGNRHLAEEKIRPLVAALGLPSASLRVLPLLPAEEPSYVPARWPWPRKRVTKLRTWPFNPRKWRRILTVTNARSGTGIRNRKILSCIFTPGNIGWVYLKKKKKTRIHQLKPQTDGISFRKILKFVINVSNEASSSLTKKIRCQLKIKIRKRFKENRAKNAKFKKVWKFIFILLHTNNFN